MEKKTKKFLNTNEKYGGPGPYIADSAEDLAESLMSVFRAWANEQGVSTEIIRARFIEGLREVE